MASFNCPKCGCHSFVLRCQNLVQQCLKCDSYRYGGRWYFYPDWSGWQKAIKMCDSVTVDACEQITFEV